jgi:hypothetical protein
MNEKRVGIPDFTPSSVRHFGPSPVKSSARKLALRLDSMMLL